MTAYAEFQQLIYRFAHHLDAQEVDQLGALFTEDGVMRLQAANGQNGAKEGRAAILEVLGANAANRSKSGLRRHIISNVIVLEETETEARTRSYVTTLRLNSDPIAINTSGVYTHHLVRTGEGWRIKELRGEFDNDELVGTVWTQG